MTDKDTINEEQTIMEGQEPTPELDATTDTAPESADDSQAPDNSEKSENSDESDTQQDTFDRSYVEKLRKENGDYRARAKTATERVADLEQRLHAALVQADGRLADPSDLPFDPSHLENPETLANAIADLISRKPGLKARQYGGDVGAGTRGGAQAPTTDLIEIIRQMQ